MFPVGKNIPKYAESWVVDIADDIAAVYEKFFTLRKELSAATTFLFVLLMNYIKMIQHYVKSFFQKENMIYFSLERSEKYE